MHIKLEADFSKCKRYRYTLKRLWNEEKGNVLFISLNPALAEVNENNSTNRRGISFAKDWGYGGVVFCNLFAYRCKTPKELKKVKDPVGEENNKFLISEANKSKLIIFSWGNHGKIMNRNIEVIKLFNKSTKVYCLGTTKQKEPKHILYLRKDLKPKIFKIKYVI